LKFPDERHGKIVVVAHCVLNQNSRVLGIARYPAVIDEIVEILRKHNIGFLQMACPELTYAGAKRLGKTREEYDTPGYRRHCRQIAISTATQLEEFAKNNVKAIAVLGIKHSPSCDVGDSDETGILMEELENELKRRRQKILMHAINMHETAADMKWLENVLRAV
jgi:predicted secreted protein